MHRYLIEAMNVCTAFRFDLLYPVSCKFYLFRSEEKKECYLYDCGAIISMKNQTFTSKKCNLGHEWDTNVKLALISGCKNFLSAFLVAFVSFQFLVGDRYLWSWNKVPNLSVDTWTHRLTDSHTGNFYSQMLWSLPAQHMQHQPWTASRVVEELQTLERETLIVIVTLKL